MTDLEICKRIAEIEGIPYCINEGIDAPFVGVCLSNDVWIDDDVCEYSPLTDDALCFQLMVRFRIELFELDGVWHCSWAGSNLVTKSDSPNKAICLAIIEAHKND